MQRIILRSFQSPGDVLMLTAAVRDLHLSHPGEFLTDVRTSADAIWANNPNVTPLQDSEGGTKTIEMRYPLIHQSNQRPYHFLHGYIQHLEQRLGIAIPLTRFSADIHLNDKERTTRPDIGDTLPERFWIIVAGGKYDFTAKWWNPASYQAVVNHFKEKITFVQCGAKEHWHPPLNGVVNLIGKTDIRQFMHLMHFADGVVCPVTFAMHLAAAVPLRSDGPPNRACVVLAGGREPPHWEAYPQHQFLHTIGQLECCATGGCWKSRCQPVGDGDSKDRRSRCERPVQVRDDLCIPQCLEMISPAEVIATIERTLEGWSHSRMHGGQSRFGTSSQMNGSLENSRVVEQVDRKRSRQVLIRFRHGLGDAVQFTAVLRHLRHYHPDWEIDVASLRGKHSAFREMCREALILDETDSTIRHYDEQFNLEWHENRASDGRWPNTKVTRCLQEVFRLTPIADLCRYEINISAAARTAAGEYLRSVCGAPDANGRYRAVLIHYQGNTSEAQKNLPTHIVAEACRVIVERGHIPIILDWDRRSPLPDSENIFCPGADHPLWQGTGTGDAERLAALIDASSLMVGIDSGPLHVAGAVSTPAIGVWTQHHPLKYFDLSPYVEHLVPASHVDQVRSAAALNYFRAAYRHRTYDDLTVELPALVESRLSVAEPESVPGEKFRHRLRSTAYSKDYYLEHQRAGLDYLNFGDWQRSYGRWLVESLGLENKRVLDVGCACGSILRGLVDAGADAHGVDVNEHMIQLGRQHSPQTAFRLHICDAVNLHLFSDDRWDAIHTAQVAEHWKPELVPHILQELRRVTVPGGLLFCCLDTEELFARQGRSIEDEDPTHICVKPMLWWDELLEKTGWALCGDHVGHRLRTHPESYLARYDWDWFVARSV